MSSGGSAAPRPSRPSPRRRRVAGTWLLRSGAMNLPRGPDNLCFDKDEFMKVRRAGGFGRRRRAVPKPRRWAREAAGGQRRPSLSRGARPGGHLLSPGAPQKAEAGAASLAPSRPEKPRSLFVFCGCVGELRTRSREKPALRCVCAFKCGDVFPPGILSGVGGEQPRLGSQNFKQESKLV